ncbi:MAG: CcmD family protein [Sphingobacteriales bacterium]|nr:MAG: CcmD family protein [Sphingobacteriales bacterium]
MPSPTRLYGFVLFLTGVLLTLPAAAQTDRPEMADLMRADGKIWVVVAVLATIFAGIFAYLIRLDRKVSRLERETN